MTESFSTVSRVIIVTAAMVVIIAGMKQAAPLLVPFLLSVFIAVISFPFMSSLQQKGLPKALAIVVVIALVILLGFGFAVLVGSSLSSFSQSLPDYQQKITAQWLLLLQWFDGKGIAIDENVREMINPGAAVAFLSSILKGFGSVLTNSFLILLMVVFLLMEAAGLTQKFSGISETGIKDDDAEFAQVFVDKLRHYMSIKTIISIATGLVIGVSLWLIGVDYPVLWGVLAFMLNFVPNIGSIIAAVPAVMLTLVQMGVSPAILVALVYLVTNIVIGSFIEPKYMGRGLGLSTLVVFVSLVFWGWVLGPVGMLLSVPLTITVKLALDSKAETVWLGHLLGPVE